MNKKQYLSPTVTVVGIRTSNLLNLSDGTTVSGNSTSGINQLSRESNGWDDDDE